MRGRQYGVQYVYIDADQRCGDEIQITTYDQKIFVRGINDSQINNYYYIFDILKSALYTIVFLILQFIPKLSANLQIYIKAIFCIQHIGDESEWCPLNAELNAATNSAG